MNKKLVRTGIFSITALLGLALASPTTASAHGRGDQHRMNMQENRYSYQQSGVDDADDESLQEWREHHNSMHQRSWNDDDAENERDYAYGSCHTGYHMGWHTGHGNMMRSGEWMEPQMNRYSSSSSSVNANGSNFN